MSIKISEERLNKIITETIKDNFIELSQFSVPQSTEEVIRARRKETMLLREECHAFERQYNWAKEIASETIKQIGLKKYNFIVAFEYDCFHYVDVTVEESDSDFLCSGELYSLDPDIGIAKIRLYINFSLLKQYNKNIAENEIYRVVTHELMHANIFLQRYKSKTVDNNDIDETPDYYEGILAAMRDNSASRNCYLFARAMYIYYYQETQAITSQAWSELESMLMNHKGVVTNSAIRDAIFCTQSYDDIISSIVLCEKINDYSRLADEISQFLSKHNIQLTSNEIISLSKKIEYRMRRMLRKFIANAYYYFKKDTKKNEKSE